MQMRIVPVLLFLMIETSSNAATIEAIPVPSTEFSLVTVTGAIEYSDIELFRTKTSTLTKAIVSFASDGGSAVAGMEIGTAIRLRNFVSLVPDGARCASACALAWLGGAKRYMGANALIGFHAAYVVKDGVPSETSAGNALVGAYLNRIGLPDRAVVYITQANPSSMTWLSLADATQEGIDVELFQAPTSSQQSIPPRPQQTLPSNLSLSPDEASMADRLAGNFYNRFKEAGLAGLNVSIPTCYEQARTSRKQTSAEYCIALDLLTSEIDLAVTGRLGTEQIEFNKFETASRRATSILETMNLGDRVEDFVGRAKLVADRALAEINERQPRHETPEAAGAVAPNLSGLKIGDPLTSISTIGLAPNARNQTGPFAVVRWDFPDGNHLSVTGSNGKIVYAESDWGGRQPGVTSDFPGLIYGKTTLSEIRKKFGSNGFAFAKHGGVASVDGGIVFLNSYEVGETIITFYTRASIAGTLNPKTTDQAVLDAISLSDQSYSNGLWGDRTYDQNYHPIEWK